ncbi:twin arginine-targeting protein translocase TatB [Hoeflea sp. IMCC20628]|uniref:Sec-independent protein translocase protein TatB n=1 Tax=Hoeflea sp. IMCC20628 TaxID=1620421 RepID=UPI00063A95C6|nr:Sec-independent protein translocase protein TatB [Hoeflea sp. IMCC20628]AKI00482.1 twin arginine-targeting protein translocase TatB [Hoeflea sp. IMCC20628]
MFDIGWPELLVVAIVLIIVVGPKDLPPMLRAFGRTTKKLKSMANEFRGQFDDALREAELGDVKKTFDEAKKLNPMQSIRDAVNPLKDTAKDIRSDLEKSVKAPTADVADKPKVDIPTPAMKLGDGPPEIKSAEPAPVKTATAGKAEPQTAAAAKPAGSVRKPGEKAVAQAPVKASANAKPAAVKTAAKPKSVATKTGAASTPAAKAKPASATKTATPAKAAPRARKPKQGEGQA